ncbi:MAG: hypothetical protein ACPGNV_08900 [Mangrovicoccus sp.]
MGKKRSSWAAIAAGLVLAAMLSGCGWYERAKERHNQAPTLEPEGGYVLPDEDLRVLVTQIDALSLSPTPQGAILTVTAQTATAGYWAPELIRIRGQQPGELRFEFRVAEPLEPVVGNGGKTLRGGVFLPNAVLERAKVIVVEGDRNSRSLRR